MLDRAPKPSKILLSSPPRVPATAPRTTSSRSSAEAARLQRRGDGAQSSEARHRKGSWVHELESLFKHTRISVLEWKVLLNILEKVLEWEEHSVIHCNDR